MMRIAALTILSFCIATAFAQDEAPGSTVTYTTPGSSCGSESNQYINCMVSLNFNGVPAGNMWLYSSLNSYTGAPYGWATMNIADLGGGTTLPTMTNYGFNPSTQFKSLPGFPTSWPAVTCNGNCAAFTGTVTGVSPDDGSAYTAQVNITIYFYRACGRGCREYGVVMPGGTAVVTYQ